ncbi:glycosyltransferase family 2 protein, partial [Lactococcus cremoris]|uniref:glycosyltransferase family 2 protein n=1 Tax=Lactococcus lactis subsp. cremoris TaxID=1359 RepID=UPI003854D8AA
MDKKVSVVVTCYNHEKNIEECLRSIFGQTHQEIELFFFNDGSTGNATQEGLVKNVDGDIDYSKDEIPWKIDIISA